MGGDGKILLWALGSTTTHDANNKVEVRHISIGILLSGHQNLRIWEAKFN